MTGGLSHFYDAFLSAVVDGRPLTLGDHLEDRLAAGNAMVYRNTVLRGAAEALSTAFPAVARMAGERYFEAVAVAYAEAHVPHARSLVGYGESFAGFLEAAPGIAEAPYLPDAARLDRAWLCAHRAADSTPLEAGALSAVSPDHLAGLHLRLHPSMRLVTLSWSVHDAWKHNRDETREPQTHVVRQQRQDVILWRPGHEVESRVLNEAEARFFRILANGQTLGDAAGDALAVSADFNTSLVFAGALEGGMFDSQQPDLHEAREQER